MENAKAILNTGMKKFITKQQKRIRVADREEHGWEVGKHYLSDELTSNSEDEKPLTKARKEALASVNALPPSSAPRPNNHGIKTVS